MKKIVLILTAATIFVWQGMSFASSSVDALIQKLEDKGILTSQDAVQLKGEIASKEQDSMQASFKNQIPDWVSGLKISGDFRLRDQIQRRKVPLAAGASNLDRNRGRFRARLNLEDQINDKVKVGLTLATEGGSDNGTLANSRSNNVTFGGNGGTNSGDFGKPYVAIDKAYVTYTPNQYITLTGGKFANPFWEPASLLFDPDLTPEGGVITLQKKLNDYITPFATNAFLVLKDASPSTAATGFRTDPYMFVSQEGIKGNLTEKLYYKVAGSYYGVSNPHRVMLDNALGVNTPSAASASFYAYDYTLVGGAMDLGINDPFGEMLPSFINIPQVGVFGQYFQNVATGVKQSSAYMMGGYMGNSAINGWGTWKIQSYYKVLERDSWLDAFPDDDFYSGDTDTKGWRSQLDVGLAKNVWFTMSYFYTDVFKHFGSGAFSKSAPENLFQMDLNFKF
jgi:hypothetical protein